MQVAGLLMPEQAISIWQLAISQTVHRKGREGRQTIERTWGRFRFVSVAVGSQADV